VTFAVNGFHFINVKLPYVFYLVINLSSYSYNTKIILIDIKLIEECRSGNLRNFRKLVELSSPVAFSVAFRMLGDEDQAKDIVQDTMVTIWQKLKKLKSPEGYKTWMYRIVVNKCYDQLRRRKRNPEFVADEITWSLISNRISEEPLANLENEETARIISLLTAKLSPMQRAVFILSELEEMSSDEISEIMGLSKSGIKANLYYARKNISEMVEKYL
jgi:RNA polymerase sigma-70 factor (ECF subfamily)